MAEDTPSKQPPATGWKDHPVIIAAAACAASLIFAQQVIFPTLTASLQNEVASARTQVAEIDKLKEKIATLETEKGGLLTKLAEAQMVNLFELGNPYPVGLGQVKIGDSADTVTKVYSNKSIERKTSYWSVKDPNTTFTYATYYFERGTKDPHVIQILFFFNSDIRALLQTKLINALGQPSYSSPEGECFIWKINSKLFVKKKDYRFFLISNSEQLCVAE